VIEMYKILTGKENIDYTQFFTLAPTHHNTTGHILRLHVSRSTLRLRQKFFRQIALGSTIGVVFLSQSWMLHPSTRSRIGSINAGKIWAFKASALPAHQSTSFKYKISRFTDTHTPKIHLLCNLIVLVCILHYIFIRKIVVGVGFCLL